MQDFDIAKRRYYSLMILGIALPFLLTPFFSSIFLSAGQSFAYRLTVSRFLIWGELGLVFLYARYAEVQPFLLWNEERYNFLFYLKFVVVLFLLVLVCGVVAHIPFWLGLRENNAMLLKMHSAMKQYPDLMVFAAFTAGVTEELIFRGYILSRLSILFDDKLRPLVISALLFSAVHLGYKSVSESIYTLLFGLLAGWHYQKYRNLRVLMLLHFLVDIVANIPKHL